MNVKALLAICGAVVCLALAGCPPYMRVPDDTRAIRIQVDGEPRDYLLHLPPGASRSQPLPLVISIHGLAQWPAHQLWLTRWNQLADEQGFVVAYPSGTQIPKRWALRGPDGLRFDPGPDVAFISRMIAAISREVPIDPARIYVNGLSNGGGMAHVLACEMAGTFAAIGTVSGAYLDPPGGCRPVRAVPLISFHGEADHIVPIVGTHHGPQSLRFPPVGRWLAAWAARNGCAPDPVTAPISEHVTRVAYGGCLGGADVEQYVIADGGHAWPGGEPLPVFISGKTTQEIDATRTMWAFFAAHARPAGGPAPRHAPLRKR